MAEDEDPYAEIGLGSISSGIPIEGYVDYSFEVKINLCMPKKIYVKF